MVESNEKGPMEVKDGNQTKKYPRYFSAPRNETELERNDQTVSEDEVEESNKVDAPSSPSRPRRNRVPPKLFTDYRQSKSSEQETQEETNSLPAISDPYKGHVFWAKFSSHPFWPSVKCTASDIAVMEKVDGISLEKASAKFGNQPCEAVIFLGSNNKAIVKSADLLDYSENFDRFTKKKKSVKSFDLGLEKADEIALRRLTENAPNNCTTCKDVVDVNLIKEQVDPNSDDVMFCERCFLFAHAKCTKKTGSFVVPFGKDSPPSWFCKRCVDEAPLSYKSRVDTEERASRKRKRKSLQPTSRKSTNGSTPFKGKDGKKKKRSMSISTPPPQEIMDMFDADHRLRAGTPPLHVSGWKSDKNRVNHHHKDKSDDYCFVCGDGGSLVICDYAGCTRSYHKYCLSGGDLAENEDDEDDEWICPWHCCAVCNSLETYPSAQSKGGSKSSQLEAGPPLSTIRSVQAILDENTLNSSNPQQTAVESKTGFIRCATCPTTLCGKHADIVRPVYNGQVSVMPLRVIRPTKKGYFKCCHCFGAEINGKQVEPAPSVAFSRYLQRAWSRIVNGHEHLCKLFLCEITADDIPSEATKAWEQVNANGITNMFRVRKKIWKLQYKNLEDLSSDVSGIARIVEAVFGSSSSLVSETAKSLPLMLDHALRSFSYETSAIEEYEIFHSKRSSRISRFEKGHLFASVDAKGNLMPGTYPTKLASSTLELERFLTNTSFKSGQKLSEPGAKPAREEAKGIVASLLTAAKAIDGFDDSLPPSRESLEEMLEQQSMILRSAMRSTSVLRDAVHKTLQQYEVGGQNDDENNIVTLGEMRASAEFRLANRGLQERCNKLKTLLSLEREGRILAEKRVEELVRQLKER